MFRIVAAVAALTLVGLLGTPPSSAQTHAAAGGDIRAGSLVVEQPWARATPAGAQVAGGYLRIRNTGTDPDRLVGARIVSARRGEVHEMSVTDGVMRMRPVEGGIPIPPGGTIELKPGGYHLMFMDLSAGLKEGEAVRGTLVFEKAGSVDVTFAVGGMGAQGPAMHH